MDQRYEDDRYLVEEEYSLPDDMVGLIIGRDGEQIKILQNETGCRVQMSPRNNEDPIRRCTLFGTRESVKAVKLLIQQIINKYQAEHFTIEMMIPGPHVGRLIGKGGENLKNLQEACGVKMVVIQDGPEPTIYEKPLRITGDQDNVEFAEQVVADFLAKIDSKGRHTQRVFSPSPVYKEHLVRNRAQSSSNISTSSFLYTDNQLCEQERNDGPGAWAIVVFIVFVLICLLFRS